MTLTANSDGSFSAFHPGALRPIVVEADTWPRALLILAEAVHEQEAEEYAYCESMSHLADVADGSYGLDGDLG